MYYWYKVLLTASTEVKILLNKLLKIVNKCKTRKSFLRDWKGSNPFGLYKMIRPVLWFLNTPELSKNLFYYLKLVAIKILELKHLPDIYYMPTIQMKWPEVHVLSMSDCPDVQMPDQTLILTFQSITERIERSPKTPSILN